MTQVQLSGSRKAAILMVILGDEASAGIFRYLDEEEIQEISMEIFRLGDVAPETADGVLEDFYRLSLAQAFLARGGPDYAKKLLNKAFGSEASKLIEVLSSSVQSAMAGLDHLQKADPAQLSRFMQSEQPQTIALVLAHLSNTQAAALLSSLPQNLQADVVMRMANLEKISPDIIGKITSVLEEKIRSLGDDITRGGESYGGVRAVAELINRVEVKTAAEILEKVEEESPSLALSIRNLMFVFDDVMLLDPAGIREILSRADKKTLALALKGTSEELRTQFFRNMSGRAVEMMKEDMDVLGPVKLKDVETAQQQIVGIVRTLDESGVINIKGSGGDEYVD
ncbi:MAG: flagellar motor switch protein FliG [Syntrophorhabdaceae bacterium]|nr:flagellar motor switch protein FliG [Syntrophorhabdaceae bacterium]